ncbi:GGDEF domain-containing protein [Gracilinema caldarium]|uniref:diguanylate cyclase n=1 Tax=Gracilinema caldarium (strain ATCC 51460 / DSM 7334 / H1) TaxID=744872 RepID=F8EYR5_GRAC1|nr:GGDEF domain-containing protein [Gracilinema caldarium]AEJ18642.1 diguanylate cyclase [Gracilinema caldarium DSM 7334]
MQDTDEFLKNPKVLSQYNQLQELGVFHYIDILKKDIRNYEAIINAAKTILNSKTIDEILESTVKEISDRFLPSFLIFLWRPSSNHKDLVIRGYQNFKTFETPLQLEDLSPFESFFKQYSQPISFDLLEYQLNNPSVTEPMKQQKPDLVIPILGPSGLYGLILIGPKLLEEQYALHELSFLDKLMSFTSLAIQNYIHYQYSVRDGKTGLYNHGFFIVRLKDEMARSNRLHQPFALIIMDVDKFKHFNDTYGHLAGDAVLEHLAGVIQKNLRSQDIPSRFGGEEFTILLPETNRASAWIVAERLRTAVASLNIPWEQNLPQVTISLGVAIYDGSEQLDSDALIQRADQALYQSKQRGRNRTTVWGSGLLHKTQQMRSSRIGE